MLILGATAIRQKLLDLSQSGKAVILISQDLEEIFELSDKICVINEGVLSEIFDVREITATDVGLLMGGKNKENQKWNLLNDYFYTKRKVSKTG